MNAITESYRPIAVAYERVRVSLYPNFIEAVTLKELGASEVAGRYNALLAERDELLAQVKRLQELLDAANQAVWHDRL